MVAMSFTALTDFSTIIWVFLKALNLLIHLQDRVKTD
jgi:hypothetical protein